MIRRKPEVKEDLARLSWTNPSAGFSDRRECSGLFKKWTSNLIDGTRLKPVSNHRMGLEVAAVVCDEPVMGDLEAWLLTFKAFHPDTLAIVICDGEVSRYVRSLIKEWGLGDVHIMPVMNQDTQATIEKRVQCVATESAYWKTVPIWWKIFALQQAICAAKGGGALVADSDVVFCKRLDESFQADMVISPFHWVDWSNEVVRRHGVFNAGFIMSRHPDASGIWGYMYEQGLDGFYEQKCMERLPGMFHCDYFGKDHNHGIWRKEPPTGSTASVHIHTHTPPAHKNWGIYDVAMESLERAKRILKP